MSLSIATHQAILALLQGVGLLAIIAVVAGTLRRGGMGLLQQSTVLGAMFGAASLVLSTLAGGPQDGVVMDGRFMCVGMAAAFGGPAAMLAAAVVGALGEPWQADIAGLTNLFGPLGTGLIALGWHRWIRGRHGTSVATLIVLGLMLSVPVLVFQSLATNGFQPVRFVLWPVAAIASVLLTLMVGMFLEREKGMLDREEALLMASLRDPLTGLQNRRSFDLALTAAMLRPGDHYLLYVDIDHFKTVNDRYGHSFGDEVLCCIARTMSQCVRAGDVVARIGGEEFGIILPDIGHRGAQALAERLLREVAGCDIRSEGEKVSVTISIGAARRKLEHSASTLMRAADTALYEAKNLGRRRVAFCEAHLFDPTPLPEAANDPTPKEVAVL